MFFVLIFILPKKLIKISYPNLYLTGVFSSIKKNTFSSRYGYVIKIFLIINCKTRDIRQTAYGVVKTEDCTYVSTTGGSTVEYLNVKVFHTKGELS